MAEQKQVAVAGIKGVYLIDGVYYGRFTYNSKRYQKNLLHFNHGKEPQTRRDAEAAMEALRAAVRNGTFYTLFDPTKTNTTDMTVAAFVQHYRTQYWQAEGKVAKGEDSKFNLIAEFFGQQPLTVWNDHQAFKDLKHHLTTTPMVIIKRQKGGGVKRVARKGVFRKGASVNRYLARCQAMVQWGIAQKLLTQNAFTGEKLTKRIGFMAENEGRNRGVSPAELKALFAAAAKLGNTAMEERLQVALHLGQRRGAMQRTQLEDIDFDEWTWTLPAYKVVDGEKVRNTKDGKTHIIPVPKALQPLFLAKRRTFAFKPQAFIFGTELGAYVASFKTAWASIKEEAKLDDATLIKARKMTLHWHDLRGQAANNLIKAGYSFEIVAEILGNTAAVVRKNYKGTLVDEMRVALNAVQVAK